MTGEAGGEPGDLEVRAGSRDGEVDLSLADLARERSGGPRRSAERTRRHPDLGPCVAPQVAQRRAWVVRDLDLVAARHEPARQMDDPLLRAAHEADRVDEQDSHGRASVSGPAGAWARSRSRASAASITAS